MSSSSGWKFLMRSIEIKNNEAIVHRIMENHAQEMIDKYNLGSIVQQLINIVDSHLEPKNCLSGRIVYQESRPHPEDWEVIIVTKLKVSGKECFDSGMEISKAINQLIISEPYNYSKWAHVNYSLELD